MNRPSKRVTMYSRHILLQTCFLFLGISALAQSDSALQLGKPDVLIVSGDLHGARKQTLIDTARGFYTFWNTGDPALLSRVISPSFTDRDLPPGRPQGPTGPLFAFRQFTGAVPDLHCEVLQQIIVQDRVVSHLRFTGRFTGSLGKVQGKGQPIDFVATDIVRIDDHGQIADNWHLEDNLTFLKQIGVVQE